MTDHDCSTGSYGGESKYLTFREIDPPTPRKTKVWEVVSKSSGSPLGRIQWYGAWRQYTFWPMSSTIWNQGCLADINAFMAAAMEARKVKT